uniref:RING-type E3 ubiquitin transferase n=1 Tax=Branchiostoma floridae TaxID=7739 RepID=C3ZFJ3_BRAFL|eukprot:XP_002592736.1 hypothetical protein BRAFLDRAFT_67176 [Branchiostoma floridae]
MEYSGSHRAGVEQPSGKFRAMRKFQTSRPGCHTSPNPHATARPHVHSPSCLVHRRPFNGAGGHGHAFRHLPSCRFQSSPRLDPPPEPCEQGGHDLTCDDPDTCPDADAPCEDQPPCDTATDAHGSSHDRCSPGVGSRGQCTHLRAVCCSRLSCSHLQNPPPCRLHRHHCQCSTPPPGYAWVGHTPVPIMHQRLLAVQQRMQEQQRRRMTAHLQGRPGDRAAQQQAMQFHMQRQMEGRTWAEQPVPLDPTEPYMDGGAMTPQAEHRHVHQHWHHFHPSPPRMAPFNVPHVHVNYGPIPPPMMHLPPMPPMPTGMIGRPLHFMFGRPTFEDLMQLEQHLGQVNRGASQSTIERNTFPYKYQKHKAASAEEDAAGSGGDEDEKCTICLSHFMQGEDVRVFVVFAMLAVVSANDMTGGTGGMTYDGCIHNGINYNVGDTFEDGCYLCECRGEGTGFVACQSKPLRNM